jgi:hypothetical protein
MGALQRRIARERVVPRTQTGNEVFDSVLAVRGELLPRFPQLRLRLDRFQWLDFLYLVPMFGLDRADVICGLQAQPELL